MGLGGFREWVIGWVDAGIEDFEEALDFAVAVGQKLLVAAIDFQGLFYGEEVFEPVVSNQGFGNDFF